jgi:hypothetical protein
VSAIPVVLVVAGLAADTLEVASASVEAASGAARSASLLPHAVSVRKVAAPIAKAMCFLMESSFARTNDG